MQYYEGMEVFIENKDRIIPVGMDHWERDNIWGKRETDDLVVSFVNVNSPKVGEYIKILEVEDGGYKERKRYWTIKNWRPLGVTIQEIIFDTHLGGKLLRDLSDQGIDVETNFIEKGECFFYKDRKEIKEAMEITLSQQSKMFVVIIEDNSISGIYQRPLYDESRSRKVFIGEGHLFIQKNKITHLGGLRCPLVGHPYLEMVDYWWEGFSKNKTE